METSVRYFEVLGQDPAKLQAFFSEVFGWKFEPVPGWEYALVQPSEDGMSGGVGKAMGAESWSTFYVKVHDVKESIAAATRLGGRVLMPLVTLPDGMDVAVVADPEGHAIGLSSR